LFFLGECLYFFTGVFFAATFFAGAFVVGFVTGLAPDLAIACWLRYLELSNARIGMNTILTKSIPSPNARCFQNFSAILR